MIDGELTATGGGSHSVASKRSDGAVWQLFLLLAASWFVPIDMWAKNPEQPDLFITFGALFVLFSIGSLIRRALVSSRLDPVGATYIAFVLVFVFSAAGPYIGRLPLGRWGVFLGAIGTACLLYRLRVLTSIRVTIAWAAFAMVVAPVFTFFDRQQPGPGNLTFAESWTTDLDDTRDVVFIVSDSYGSPAVLDEFYGFDNSPFVEELVGLGFVVASDAHSNYSSTIISIPSMLELGLIATNETITNTDARRLYSIMGGEGTVPHVLAQNGYRTVYVESGWLGTQCSDAVDICVPAPWPDETLYDIARRSLLRDLLVFEMGAAFSRGAKHALTWLEHDLDAYLSDDVPDFVYVHLLAPHPPLFLEADCRLRPRRETSGFVISLPSGHHERERIDAYLDQVRCVNRTLGRVARAVVETGSVALFVGDHGPDIDGQLFAPAPSWNRNQIRARFGAMFAGYGKGCDFDRIEYVGNVGIRLLNCLGSPTLADLEPRAFLVGFSEPPFDGVHEIDPRHFWGGAEGGPVRAG
ncbi:MAG: sulfatase-like hydrolase/transferase [Acidimicrobiia bacterium]